jgi:hypothetical protein
MLVAGYATWTIVEVRWYSPERYKMPAALWQAVIPGRWPPALRATPSHTRMRLQGDGDPFSLDWTGVHVHFLVNESHKPLYSIENGLNL